MQTVGFSPTTSSLYQTHKIFDHSITRRLPPLRAAQASAASIVAPQKPAKKPSPNSTLGKFTSKVSKDRILFHGVHHVGLLCKDLERSLEFYCNTLGLEINPDRPDDKLPYRGAWLWIGPEMIHLMELPNPDPLDGRPTHGGRDRHFCVGVESVEPLEAALKQAGVEYTRSMSGRAAIFFRDPDMNCLECVELQKWR